MATIMGTTTLAFTFGGLSIVLVLVLLRGGTLDHCAHRGSHRWSSRALVFMDCDVYQPRGCADGAE